MKDYRIAMYIRLSNADEQTGRGQDESGSITHQRMLLNHFLDSRTELAGCPRSEFVDDGYSGTNTDRPGFQRMVRMVREGAYNLVIVKDLSRFSRDYIETGDYLECVFPFLGVRFISVNEGYDSAGLEGTAGGLEAAVRSIIHAAYSRDLSIKVKTAKQKHREKGEYIDCVPPLGYRKDPADRHRLAIDEEGAAVVRRIFHLAAGGTKVSEIARMLNADGVPTPTRYYAARKPGTRQNHSAMGGRWSYSSVYVILKRYSYTGALVANVRQNGKPGSRHYTKQDQSKWTIMRGQFEAIVTEEEYEQAQRIFQKQKKTAKKAHDYPLKSLVRCGCCGRVMKRRVKGYGYVCRFRNDAEGSGCETAGFSTEHDLEGIVSGAIRDMAGKAALARDRKALTEKGNGLAKDLAGELSLLSRRADRIHAARLRDYEKYTEGAITKEAFLDARKEAAKELDAIQVQISEKEKELAGLKETDPRLEHVMELADRYRDQEGLTNDMARAFIDAVYIHPGGTVEIKWKYADCFEGLMLQGGEA